MLVPPETMITLQLQHYPKRKGGSDQPVVFDVLRVRTRWKPRKQSAMKELKEPRAGLLFSLCTEYVQHKTTPTHHYWDNTTKNNLHLTTCHFKLKDDSIFFLMWINWSVLNELPDALVLLSYVRHFHINRHIQYTSFIPLPWQTCHWFYICNTSVHQVLFLNVKGKQHQTSSITA